jgi:4-hydroxybenzoate polyprenyltransferase
LDFNKKWMAYIQLCRLNRPIGIWLLFFPCLWSFIIATQGLSLIKWASLFLLGAVVMRGAGCIYNDLIDQQYDRQVDRTKNRPLAAHYLSNKEATRFLISHLLIAFGIACVLPSSTYLVIFFSLILVFLYPWMKRITYWPQLFLAIGYNLGIFMAWKVFNKPLTIPIVLLYMAGIFWTIGYDTVYSYQDWQDDQRINVKSTGLRFLHCPKIFLTIMYAMVIILLGAHGYLQQWPAISYGILTGIAGHYIWQIFSLNPYDGQQCQRIFLSNKTVGYLITLSLLLANFPF